MLAFTSKWLDNLLVHFQKHQSLEDFKQILALKLFILAASSLTTQTLCTWWATIWIRKMYTHVFVLLYFHVFLLLFCYDSRSKFLFVIPRVRFEHTCALWLMITYTCPWRVSIYMIGAARTTLQPSIRVSTRTVLEYEYFYLTDHWSQYWLIFAYGFRSRQ